MDAAYKQPKVTILFLTLALLAIAPWHAQAQTFSTTTASLTLSSTGAQSLNIAGTGDNASPTNPITFSYSIAYSGDPAWISLNNGCAASGPGGVTPTSMTFATGCFAGQLSPNTTHTATVTLTPTAPAGATGTEVITVSYYSGGAGTQTLNPSTSVVGISAAVGGTGLGSFSLSTTSAVPVSYNISENPAVSWLTFTQNQSATVTAGSPVTVGLEASAGSMSAGTYNTSLQITFNGTTLNVSVNFTIGSGTSNGTLSFGQNSFSFSYTSGGALPNVQSTSITNSSAVTYTFSVNASPSTWLAVNGQVPNNGTVSSPILIGTQINLQPNSFATQLGTGSYTAIVTVTDSNNNTGTITVNLSVNGGSSGFTVSPNPITLSASSGSSLVQVNVSVTSTLSGTLTASVTGSGLSIPAGGGSSQTVTAGVAATVIVQGNPSGLSGTYTGSLLLQLSTSAISQSYSVTFTVGSSSGGGGGSSVNVAPTSLNFYYEIGQNATAGQLSQQITIGGPGNFTLGTGQPTENNDTGVAWLNAAQPIQGSPGSLVTISVSPTLSAGPLAAGTYTGSYTVTFPGTGQTQQVNVTLTVANTAGLVANPGVVNVNCNQCASPQPTQFIQVVATDGSSLPITVSATSTGGWLTASVSSTGGTTPTSVQYQVTPGSLANGLYSGSIAVTSGALTLNIPVVLYVQGSSTSGGGNLTLSTSSLTFNAQVNGSVPGSQNLSVTAGSTTNFTASAVVTTTSSGIQWLSITPSGNLNTNQTLVVSAAQTGLPVGTYSGSIQLTSGGITQSVAVTLNVSTTGTGSGGNVTVTPSSLTNFTYQIGSTVPASQTLSVASASGSAGISFTAAANSTGGNWLVVSPTSATTSASLTVSLSAGVLSALSAGTYTGNIVITPSGGTVDTLPVSLTVMSAPTVTATPTSLSFPYQSGGSTPSPQSITVSGSTSGLSFTATSAVSGSGSWLSITPASGTTPGSIAVSVNPAGLSAGTYTGTVTVTGSGGAIGSNTINVTLTVTAPLPTITAVVNAASFMGGFQVSPGEIVSIGGTALGPTPGVSLVVSSGQVSTSIGGVTVLFNGFAAPLIYVSATQINCVVPYEIAGSISPYVQVKYLGQTSNAWSLQSAVAAPAIFTANAGGTGPGAILNPDGSFNSQKAAPKGGEIAVYMTGEGQTTPPGVTGKVTTANLPAPQVTPAPLLPVSALVGGQPALVVYQGEAPGLVSGVMQVNVIIPATAPTGNLSITISVGTASSQQGVTVAVQ